MLACLRLIVALALLLLPSMASAQSRRVALVVGNSSYRHVERLPNPVNDATAIGQALERLLFDKVTVLRNLGAEDLRRALLAFEIEATGADIALVYFAGHGMEVDGQNYLIPTDARLARSAAIDVEAIPLSTVTAMMAGARKLRLVILDACRNNPFRAQMLNDTSGKKRSIGRGLGRIEPSENELVAYAAAGGTEADDGSGRHSPFTTALLKHIEVPGLEVGFLFRHVRDDVMAATGRQQQPHLYGTLGREPIYLRKADPVAALQAPVAQPRPAVPPAAARAGNAAVVPAPAAAAPATAGVDLKPRQLKLRARIARQSTDEKGSRGWLGLNITPANEALAKILGIGAARGSWVVNTTADGPARPAGIRPGDLIVRLDGRDVVKSEDLPRLVQLIPIDSEVDVELWRIGEGIEDAMRLLRSRADNGDAAALMTIASIYSDGIGVARNGTEALRWLRRGADAGSALAMNELGVAYINGRGVAKDPAEAARWYRKAAQAGEPRAMNSLGWLLAGGNGTDKDEAEATRWYRRAAEAGLAAAMDNLADMYRDGRGVAKDEAEAVRWYRRGAEAGEGEAMNSMGWMHQNGRGVAKDDAEAVRWYRRGADAGHSMSMNNLGWMYQNGRGIEKNDAEAIRWYRVSSNAGNLSAMNNIGWMYDNGRGVAKDRGEALRWYRKAADGGSTFAMQNLAAALDDGRGVARDRPAAAELMLKALRGRHESALNQMRNNWRNWSSEYRRELQRLLRDAGVYDGPIDGSFGKPTMAAIEAIYGKKL